MTDTTASWALEPSGLPEKYALRAQLGALPGSPIARAWLLHERLEDAVLQGADVDGLLTGDAEILFPRWIDCRFLGAELSATRVVGGYFLRTTFVAPSLRGVVFSRCVFDRSSFECSELPGPENVRFERCTFVESPRIPVKRWREAGVLDADCRTVDASATVGAAVSKPSPSVPPPAEAPVPPTAAKDAPASGPSVAGRFGALER